MSVTGSCKKMGVEWCTFMISLIISSNYLNSQLFSIGKTYFLQPNVCHSHSTYAIRIHFSLVRSGERYYTSILAIQYHLTTSNIVYAKRI